MMDRDEKIKLYIEGAKAFFPNIRTSQVFSMFAADGDNKPSSGKIELSLESFSEPPVKTQFIHYTSVDSLLNIINSKNIRLYNCFNLNDPKEIDHSLKLFGLDVDDKSIANYKRNHFVLSGSLYDGEDDFNLWRLYGQSGNGVGIVFELEEHHANWGGFNAIRVEYDTKNESAKRIIDYISFHRKFNDEHHLFENIPISFIFLALQLKNPIWSVEREFRLTAYCPFDQYTLMQKEGSMVTRSIALSSTLEHSIGRNGENVSYVQLPIFFDEENYPIVKSPYQDKELNLADYAPRLKMKEVVLGYNIQGKHMDNLEKFLMTVPPMKLGYHINISRSKIFD